MNVSKEEQSRIGNGKHGIDPVSPVNYQKKANLVVLHF
jgi:hypothetical protein